MTEPKTVLITIPDISQVEFRLKVYPEDTDYRGNVVCTEDEKADKEVENWVEKELRAGNGCAWCCVEISATWKWITESAYRGCCSYKSYGKLEEDIFTNNSEHLKEEAFEFLVERIQSLAQ